MKTLAISDNTEFQAKFTLKDGKVNKIFSATFSAKRLSQDEIQAQLEACEYKYKAFLEADGLITDWQGQRLVLDEQGQPVPFSPEALSLFLSPSGVAKVVFDAYQKDCGAKEKN